MTTAQALDGLPLHGFQHPAAFICLIIPVALALAYIVIQRRRRRRLLQFANFELLESVRPRRPHRLRHLPVVVMLIALVFLTVAVATPTKDTRIPRNRAVIMLAIDVSQSMRATDVDPDRLDAAKAAAKQFTQNITPGVNVGLIAFAGTANILVSPNPDRQATIAALDNLKPADSTAIGDAVFAALQSIKEVAAVLSGGGGAPPPPARIVLLSDGKETKPSNPDAPHGAFTAARSARDQGIPVSTISFGSDHGVVSLNDQQIPVPVDGSTLKQVAQLSGGQAYTATNVAELNRSYGNIQQQIGYQTTPGPASAMWLRLSVLFITVAVIAAVFVNRRLPT